MRRRDFLRATAGGGAAAAAAVGATGTAAAQPSFDGWMSGVGNYSSVTDQTGSDSVTVQVGASGNGGAFAFEPAAVQVDPGTEITWEWTGEGSQHNVLTEEGPASLESELTAEAGFTYSHTFEEEGVTKYYCQPHRSLGMKGVVVVGEVPGDGGGEGGGGGSTAPQVPQSALTPGVATTVAMIATLGLAFVFLKYGSGTAPE